MSFDELTNGRRSDFLSAIFNFVGNVLGALLYVVGFFANPVGEFVASVKFVKYPVSLL